MTSDHDVSVYDASTPPPQGSIYPFLTDVGLVMVLVGLFLIGKIVAVLGAVLLAVALTGWWREARADYEQLAE